MNKFMQTMEFETKKKTKNGKLATASLNIHYSVVSMLWMSIYSLLYPQIHRLMTISSNYNSNLVLGVQWCSESYSIYYEYIWH